MKRRELMAVVALAAGLSSGLSTTTNAYAEPKSAVEQENARPGHFIGRGHLSHGNGNGYGHYRHDHEIY